MPERREDDQGVFAENVRRRRENQGWTRKQLCEEARISPQTLKGIEEGKGCTPAVERKLAEAFRTVPGRLWEPLPQGFRQIHRSIDARWYFAEVAEGTRYRDRLAEEGGEGPLRMDPESIQSAAERSRLGTGGLACGFVRITTAYLGGRTVLSSELEVYGSMGSNAPDGELMYVYVLEGEILFHTDGTTDALGAGDVLQAAVRAPSWIRPRDPVARGSQAPRVVVVDLGSMA